MDFKTAEKFLKKENLIKIGKTLKTHGYKGHLAINEYVDLQNFDFLVIEKDGFYIPFNIETEKSMFHLSPQIIKFEMIDNIETAKKFTNLPVFVPISLFKEKNPVIENFQFAEGFQLIYSQKGRLGIVEFFYNIKTNPYFELDNGRIIPLNVITDYKFDLETKQFLVTLKEDFVLI